MNTRRVSQRKAYLLLIRSTTLFTRWSNL